MGHIIAFRRRHRTTAALTADQAATDRARTRAALGSCVSQPFNDAQGYAMVSSFDDLAAILAGMICRPAEIYGPSETGLADQVQSLAAMAARIEARGDDPAAPLSAPVLAGDTLVARLRRFLRGDALGEPRNDPGRALLPAMEVRDAASGAAP